MTTSGDLADLRSWATLKRVVSLAEGFGGNGTREVGPRVVEDDATPCMMSAGRSTKDGPGRP